MLSSNWQVTLRLTVFKTFAVKWPKFRICGSWGVPPPKGEKICPGPICTIVQNFTPTGATVAEISVTGQRTKHSNQYSLPYQRMAGKKQTVAGFVAHTSCFMTVHWWRCWRCWLVDSWRCLVSVRNFLMTCSTLSSKLCSRAPLLHVLSKYESVFVFCTFQQCSDFETAITCECDNKK